MSVGDGSRKRKNMSKPRMPNNGGCKRMPRDLAFLILERLGKDYESMDQCVIELADLYITKGFSSTADYAMSTCRTFLMKVALDEDSKFRNGTIELFREWVSLPFSQLKPYRDFLTESEYNEMHRIARLKPGSHVKPPDLRSKSHPFTIKSELASKIAGICLLNQCHWLTALTVLAERELGRVMKIGDTTQPVSAGISSMMAAK